MLAMGLFMICFGLCLMLSFCAWGCKRCGLVLGCDNCCGLFRGYLLAAFISVCVAFEFAFNYLVALCSCCLCWIV